MGHPAQRVELEPIFERGFRFLQKAGIQKGQSEIAVALHVEWIKRDCAPAKSDRFVRAAKTRCESRRGQNDVRVSRRQFQCSPH